MGYVHFVLGRAFDGSMGQDKTGLFDLEIRTGQDIIFSESFRTG